jgi:RNA polymerase sigma-70 factor, ECF subfamily
VPDLFLSREEPLSQHLHMQSRRSETCGSDGSRAESRSASKDVDEKLTRGVSVRGKPLSARLRLSSGWFSFERRRWLSRDATNADVRPDAGGSRVDLGRLFEAHAAAMYRTILAYTGGRGDLAEEAVGEAFSRASARARLRDPVAWLDRVAFNVANDELRRERRHGVGVHDTVQQPPDLSEVLEALKRLPPRERAVMALFYVLDLPVREVAARLGIAAATVRVHLTRGRRHLAALLGDEEMTDR